jgi:type II secretion system protein D
VAIDKNANALILSGPTHELDQIDRIITELSYSYISSDAEFRIFPLKEADPVVVARTLTELFKPEPIPVPPQQQQQQQQPRGAVRVVAPAPKVTAVSEPRTRSVIVRAKPTDFTLLESLIKQLDVTGVSSQLEFHVVVLTNAPPEKVAPLVEQMVKQLNVTRPGEPLSITLAPRAHGLFVVARDTVMTQVENMIHSLDTPSPYAEAEVLVVSLKKASASQLATLLQSMLKPGSQGEATPEARELQEQIRLLKVKNDQGQEVVLDLKKPIRILGDPLAGGQGGGNRLILSSTPDNLKALAAVVEMMDTVPVAEGVNVKLAHLQFADAATVAETLTSIFSQGRRLGVGPSGRAEPEGTTGKALVNPLNVAVDERSNTVILSGQKESLELAQKVINDLDRKIDRFITEVKIFRLKYATARRLSPLLQAVFAEGRAVPGSEGLATQVTRMRALLPDEKAPTTEQPKSRSALIIQADDTTNMLIVAARSDTLPLIEAVINQLDIPAASGMANIRVYALDHADPLVIQKIITDLHSGPRMSQLRTEDIPTITVDERTQSLIVSGTQKAFAFIDGLIAQLDKELPVDLRDIRVVPLENADAGTVAASLQRLMDARVTQKAALGRQQAEALRVMIIAEARSNSLLVAGSKDSFELVESLAHELDAAPPALSGRIRLIPLAYADARTLSTALINLFNQRYQAARSPETQRNRPVIVPDARSNSLLVAAGVDDNQTIDDLVSRLDQRLEDPSMVLTVIGLRHNNSATVATMLESIFAARLRSRTISGQPASPQDQIKIEPDSLNNSLIISASKENLELIVGLLEKIDVEPVVAEGVVQTFTLQFADAQRVANMLRGLVQQGLYRPGQTGGRGPRESMAVSADPQSNTLIVSASPENLAVIKEVIRQMDTKELAQAGNVRFYSLKHARASSLSTVLQQFFQARRQTEAGASMGERSIPVSVVPDDRANMLLVTGGRESFDVIDRMIEQLDGEDVQARMGFRVFILKQATAAKLQSTLQRLFTNRPSRIKGEPPEPITIVADSWVNALIVGASVDDMAMVQSLVERLDSDQAQLGVTVQVFPLAKADARRVSQIVQSLYRDSSAGGGFPIAVSADDRMNAIVVSAGEADLKRIGDLVKKLDTDQVGRVSEIRIFPLEHARADAVAQILNTALNTKPALMTDQSPNSASLLQFITQGSDGQQIVASALKEGVLITADLRMNSLVVSAPVDYMNLLQQIITKLDSSPPQQAKIKVFTLLNADARMMAELLMTMFRLQPTGQPAVSQRAIRYTLVKDRTDFGNGLPEDPADPGEEELASATLGTDEQGALHVTVDERTNSLLVGGTDHYVALVSQIIQTLDSSEAQERKTDIYRLRNAQALDIATAVRTFLDQDRQRITQVLGQEAVGTAQRMLEREVGIVAETNSNTLLISASPRFFGQLTNMIVQLDQPRPQVLIQVLLAEVTLDSTQDLGVEWNLTKMVQTAQVGTGTDFGVLNDLKNFGGFSTAVTGSDYNFLIRALQNDGRLEVLSRPQILTADNKPATIDVGQRVPLLNNTTVTPQGGSFSGINYENVGVNLEVTPRIGADGAVRMEISTTNSALSSSTVNVPSGSGTVPVPIINERRASTFVSVQSGQSILIGGLIETSDDVRVKKVPFLGDIPGLGVLFRSKTKVQNRQELLILLTPQVLLMNAAPAKMGDVEEMTRQQLERSSLRDQIHDDKARQQLLEPLFPKGLKPEGKPSSPDGSAGAKSKN